MKKYLLLVLFCSIVSSGLFAQDGNVYMGYLFDQFQNGKAVYVGGNYVDRKFNYDPVNEVILFLGKDNTVLELAQPDKISHVTIGNRTFEHVGKGVFYEKIKAGDDFLYVRWKGRIVSEGVEIGYGLRSTTTASRNFTHMSTETTTLDLKSTEKFKDVSSSTYYLKEGDKFKRFSSFNALAKLFKGHEDEIKGYIEGEKLDFKKLDDVLVAVAHVAQYNK